MATPSNQKPEVLLILMPWEIPEDFVDHIKTLRPGIEVLIHQTGRHDTEVPKEITEDTWNRVTVLFAWKALPPKDIVPNLEYVQLLSAGCNHVADHPLFRDTDVTFCTANGVHPPQMAEWVIATFLGFQHHLYQYWEDQQRQTWVVPESDEDTEDAVGLRMGILGYGAIGRQCARLAKALGMDVHAFTLHERPTPESRVDTAFAEPGLGDPIGDIPSRWFHGLDQLNGFLSGLDLLVITLPLTSATKHIISKEQLDALGKRKGFLCNVARGPVVNTDDLIAALNNGTIRGAALDVTDPEPLPSDHALWKAKNVIITPHVSGNSNHYNERVLKIIAENIHRRAQEKPLINMVKKSLGY